jgi:hypothetical protein
VDDVGWSHARFTCFLCGWLFISLSDQPFAWSSPSDPTFCVLLSSSYFTTGKGLLHHCSTYICIVRRTTYIQIRTMVFGRSRTTYGERKGPRWFVILPILLAIVAFVCSMLCLFAGYNQGFLENYDILSVRPLSHSP